MDYEHLPGDGPLDETDVSLRAYLANLTNEHLAEYDPAWTDDQVLDWDGNFRSDGGLMLVCCERDIEVAEFRRALEEHCAFGYYEVPVFSRGRSANFVSRLDPHRGSGAVD